MPDAPAEVMTVGDLAHWQQVQAWRHTREDHASAPVASRWFDGVRRVAAAGWWYGDPIMLSPAPERCAVA